MKGLSHLSPPSGQSVGGVWSTAGGWRRSDSVEAIGWLTSKQRPRAANNREKTEKAQSKLNKPQQSQRKTQSQQIRTRGGSLGHPVGGET